MSAPAPLTVKMLFSNVELPRTPTAPTSWLCHGTGSPPVVVEATCTLSNVDVFSVDVSWLVTARPASTVDGSADRVTKANRVQTPPSSETAASTCWPVRFSRRRWNSGSTVATCSITTISFALRR